MNASLSPGEPGSPRFVILQVVRAAVFVVSVFLAIGGLVALLDIDVPVDRQKTVEVGDQSFDVGVISSVHEQRQAAIRGVGSMAIGFGMAFAMGLTLWREWKRSRTGEYPGTPTWVKVLLVAWFIGILGGFWLVDSIYPAA